MSKLLTLASITLAAALGANDLNLAGIQDDGDAGRAAARWATSIGMKPERVFESGAMAIRESYGWFVTVRTGASDSIPDRIIMTTIIQGRPSNKNSPEVAALVNRLNAQYNVCNFHVDDDGDLAMQFNLCFDDALSPLLFRKFVRHIELCRRLIYENESADLGRFFK